MGTICNDKIELLLSGEMEIKNKDLQELSVFEMDRYITIISELLHWMNEEKVKCSSVQLARLMNTLGELYFYRGNFFSTYTSFHGMAMALEKDTLKLDLHTFLMEWEKEKKQKEDYEFKKLLKKIFK